MDKIREEHRKAHEIVNNAYNNRREDIAARDFSNTPAREHGSIMDTIFGSHSKSITTAEKYLKEIHSLVHKSGVDFG